MSGPAPLRLFAHRGISARYPENTLAAFAAAHAEGCSAIELDVQLTRDERLVVFHDDDLKRMTGNPTRIDQLTYDEVLAFDVGSWKAPAFRGARVPTLAQVAEAFPHGLINIELKSSGAGNAALAAAVAAFLHERPRLSVVVSSFDWPLLESFRRHDATSPLGVLFEADQWSDAMHAAAQLDAGALNAAWQVVSEAPVRECRERGLEVNVFTVNLPDTARALAAQGVTGLFTDDAPQMAAALGQAA
jgi:glycerophosphoryl diester phosphodiesterase